MVFSARLTQSNSYRESTASGEDPHPHLIFMGRKKISPGASVPGKENFQKSFREGEKGRCLKSGSAGAVEMLHRRGGLKNQGHLPSGETDNTKCDESDSHKHQEGSRKAILKTGSTDFRYRTLTAAGRGMILRRSHYAHRSELARNINGGKLRL